MGKGPGRDGEDKERNWQCYGMSWQDLPGLCAFSKISLIPRMQFQAAGADTRGGALEVRDSGPSGHSPSPMCLPACRVPGPQVVVEDNFSSFLGLAGPAHCWGGVAAVEGNSASDPSLERVFPCSWPRQGRGVVRTGSEMAGPVGTFPGGLVQALSHGPVTQSRLCAQSCARHGDAGVRKANSLPLWTYHLTGVGVVTG